MTDCLPVLFHPGECSPPVCTDCEGKFIAARKAGAIKEVNAKVLAACFDPDQMKVSLVMDTQLLSYKEPPFGQPNALVMGGKYRGHWAHRVHEGENGGTWFLARPNRNTRAGIVAPREPVDSLVHLSMWDSALTKLQKRQPIGVLRPGITFDFSDYFSD